MPRHVETTYQKWIKEQGVPIIQGHGVTDVQALELAPWERMGGNGAITQLDGMEGLTGMYVAEIPPGGSLRPEKHLYDEVIYILSGRGAAEVWGGTSERAPHGAHMFEWQTGALFAPPINAWHRLLNGSGQEPVRVLVATTAPLVMDLYHNVDFVFGCPFQFSDRFDGRPDYFAAEGKRELSDNRSMIWRTNFIPDVRSAVLESQEGRGDRVQMTGFELAENALIGHMVEWPVGRYKKAHHHGGGAVLLIVRSTGYSLMWPQDAGVQPFARGNGDKVARVDWQEGSVFSPPTGWFHQHFNTGSIRARQLATRYGSLEHPAQFHESQSGEGDLVSVMLGGTQIEYQDEDPEIKRLFDAELRKSGVTNEMLATASA